MMIKYQVADWERHTIHDVLILTSKDLNAPILNSGLVRDFPFVSWELVMSSLCCIWMKQFLNLIQLPVELVYSPLGLFYLIYILFLNLETRVQPACRTKSLPLESSLYVIFLCSPTCILLLTQNSLSFRTCLSFL